MVQILSWFQYAQANYKVPYIAFGDVDTYWVLGKVSEMISGHFEPLDPWMQVEHDLNHT